MARHLGMIGHFHYIFPFSLVFPPSYSTIVMSLFLFFPELLDNLCTMLQSKVSSSLILVFGPIRVL